MHMPNASLTEVLVELAKNKHYVVSVAALVMITFGSGGMADWFPTYLQREASSSLNLAGLVVGGVTVIGGLGGVYLGAHLGEYAKSRTKNPYFLVSGVGLVCNFFFFLCSLPDLFSPSLLLLLIYCFLLLLPRATSNRDGELSRFDSLLSVYRLWRLFQLQATACLVLVSI